VLRSYGVTQVTGDKWAGQWPQQAFAKCGIYYLECEQSKSDLYRTLLPRVMAQQVELRPISKLRAQLVGLERRTARGGKDTIDDRPAGRDDLINAVAIVLATGAPDFGSVAEWVPTAAESRGVPVGAFGSALGMTHADLDAMTRGAFGDTGVGDISK